MTQSYKELLKQREALELAISQARKNEISAAVAKVRELVAEFGLTAQDVFPGRASKGGVSKAVSKAVTKPVTKAVTKAATKPTIESDAPSASRRPAAKAAKRAKPLP